MEEKLLEGSGVEQCSLQSVLSNMWKLFTFNKDDTIEILTQISHCSFFLLFASHAFLK